MSNVIPTLKYAILTLKHKWFVFLAGLRTKAPIWLLIIHDWSKFSPSELPHYGRQFFGAADDGPGFISCWIHHQNHNPHHWEYHIPRTGHNRCSPPYPDNVSIPMPMTYVREMVADWLAASRTYEGVWPTGASWPWYERNIENIFARVHPVTKSRIIAVIQELWSTKEPT